MEDDLFDKTGKVNVALLKEHLMKEGTRIRRPCIILV
jgi:hypothetical protein